MAGIPHRLLLWSPRILGVLTSLFLGLFALDSFGNGKSFVREVSEFLVHLAPSIGLLGVVALSWRREWIGGVVFAGLALGYSCMARNHLPWILTISGPLLLVGLLYFWNWGRHRTLGTR